MKKTFVIAAMLLLCVLCLWADRTVSDKMEFSIRWLVDNTEVTTLRVLDFNRQHEFEKVDGQYRGNLSYTPQNGSTRYQVCCVEYTTNKRGLSYLQFAGTPLVETNVTWNMQFGYRLVMTLNHAEYPLDIVVGYDEDRNKEIFPIRLLASGSSTFYIDVEVAFTDYDYMPIDSSGSTKDYQATVTISRWSEE